MELEFFPYPCLAGIFVLCLALVILGARKHSPSYLFCFALFGIYILAVIGVTLFPVPLLVFGPRAPGDWHSAADIIAQANFIPFTFPDFDRGLNPQYVILREVVANILLAIPFGFGLPFVARVRAISVPFLALGFGIGIELAQLLACLGLSYKYRGVNIDDALMNALGVLAGYGLFRVFAWLYLLWGAPLRHRPGGLLGYFYVVANSTHPEPDDL
jgi:glycopeptide antibiotics resistance protein